MTSLARTACGSIVAIGTRVMAGWYGKAMLQGLCLGVVKFAFHREFRQYFGRSRVVCASEWGIKHLGLCELFKSLWQPADRARTEGHASESNAYKLIHTLKRKSDFPHKGGNTGRYAFNARYGPAIDNKV